jgi:putative sterol carrier protein
MEFPFDPQRALDQLRSLAADAPAQLAEGVGRLVRDASPERLDQLMTSPARRPVLEAIFWQMPRQLDPAKARGVSTVIRWQITGGPGGVTDTYDLQIEGGRALVGRGGGTASPKLTITMDGAELVRLVSGNSDPMAAYFKGRIQLAGDIMVAAQMAQMFRMPGGAAPPSNGVGDRDDLPPGG